MAKADSFADYSYYDKETTVKELFKLKIYSGLACLKKIFKEQQKRLDNATALYGELSNGKQSENEDYGIPKFSFVTNNLDNFLVF